MNRIEYFENICQEFQNGYGVEVGTFKGWFSKVILSRWNGRLYMVDVWKPLGEEYIDASNHSAHHNVWEDAMKNIEGYDDRAIMIRTSSKLASTMFADESLDFVYIDANHAYDFVKEDIECWYPKVKVGGYLWGHDYLRMDWSSPPFLENGKDRHIWSNDGKPGSELKYAGVFGVNPAVDEFCLNKGYTPFLTSEWDASWSIKKM